MLRWTVLLFVCCRNICNCQFLQPLKFLDKVLDLHERSRNVLSGGDSMKLNVDLSSAKDFPVRDDLRLRVFNKDNNATMCDTKLFDHVDAGQFPCSFDENAAHLKHGANNFELEVYSDISWKVYATQQIPDIHYFDSFSYEGYYDNFVDTRDTKVYAQKILVTSIFTLLVAHLVITGPAALKSGGIFVYDIFSSGLASPYGMILSGTGMLASQIATLPYLGSKGIIFLMTAIKASVIFLYDIFSSGLASPFSMILSGSSALTSILIKSLRGSSSALKSGFESFFTFLSILYGDSSILITYLLQLLSNGSKGAVYGFISAMSYLLTSITSNSHSAFKQLLVLGGIFFGGMMKLPKSSAMLLLATGQFVFDIFSAGLSSPAGMMMSGIYIVEDNIILLCIAWSIFT